jgi:hypothetical protein
MCQCHLFLFFLYATYVHRLKRVGSRIARGAERGWAGFMHMGSAATAQTGVSIVAHPCEQSYQLN